jgi:hypothetical protein
MDTVIFKIILDSLEILLIVSHDPLGVLTHILKTIGYSVKMGHSEQHENEMAITVIVCEHIVMYMHLA